MFKRIIAGVILPVALSGCAWSSYWELRESRQALEACEEIHGPGSEVCEGLQAQADQDLERYENEARIGWGCGANATEENCPRPR